MKSRPTDPISNHKATTNKHIFYFGLKETGHCTFMLAYRCCCWLFTYCFTQVPFKISLHISLFIMVVVSLLELVNICRISNQNVNTLNYTDIYLENYMHAVAQFIPVCQKIHGHIVFVLRYICLLTFEWKLRAVSLGLHTKMVHYANITWSIFIMPPIEKGGAYCFAHVGRYVGIPLPCATDDSGTLCPRSFKLGR